MTGNAHARWRKFDSPEGLFLVLSREKNTTVDRRQFHQAHLDWLNKGHDDERVLLSGPSHDRTLGIYVVRSKSLQEANEYVASDPYHAEGVRAFEIIEWEIQRRTLVPGLNEEGV